MVFQHPQEQMVATTIEEDVAFGPENLGLETSEIRSRVKQALDAVNLWDIRDRSPQHLSAGQMQRVALAGILAMRPACVIFDEATAMLDPIGRRDIHLSIKKLREQGITIITITHFMNEVVHADRVLTLHQGELVFDGTPQDLFNNTALLEKTRLTKPRVTTIAQRLSPWIPVFHNPLTPVHFKQQIQNFSPNVTFNKSNQPPTYQGNSLNRSHRFIVCLFTRYSLTASGIKKHKFPRTRGLHIWVDRLIPAPENRPYCSTSTVCIKHNPGPYESVHFKLTKNSMFANFANMWGLFSKTRITNFLNNMWVMKWLMD